MDEETWCAHYALNEHGILPSRILAMDKKEKAFILESFKAWLKMKKEEHDKIAKKSKR